MNYAQIRAFFHVVQEGGVGRAAKLLGVSQPTISQHINSLEARHGMRLFVKRGRGLALTEAGRDLFSLTERLIRAADEVDDALERRGALSGGRLRVVSDSPALAVELLDRFRRQHRSVEVSISIATLPRIVSEIREAAADVGVTVEPPAGGDLVIAPLTNEPLLVTVSAQHRLAERDGISIEDLVEETVILREEGSRTRMMIERAFAMLGRGPRETLVIGGREAIREAIARNIGVSLFARSECPPDARLRHLPIEVPGLRLTFDEHIVVRRDYRRVSAIAAFFDVAAEFAAEAAGAEGDACAAGEGTRRGS